MRISKLLADNVKKIKYKKLTKHLKESELENMVPIKMIRVRLFFKLIFLLSRKK